MALDAYKKISMWQGGGWIGMASGVEELFGRQPDLNSVPAGSTFVVHFNDNPADYLRGNNFFAGWDGNVFVKFNSNDVPTRVMSWVACDYQGQPSAAVVDPEGNVSVWDGSKWYGLARGANEQRPNSGELVGSPTYRPALFHPGMTFVVRLDGDRFAGWDGSNLVKFSVDNSNNPTRVMSWVACDFQGQPSVAVMVSPADTGGRPLFYVWVTSWTPTGPDTGTRSGQWLPLVSGVVQLFGRQTFQKELTFVVRVNDDPINYKGNNFFAGWDGNAFVKFNSNDAPTRVKSWDPVDPNAPVTNPNAPPDEPRTPIPLQKITTEDGRSYVWTGTQWVSCST